MKIADELGMSARRVQIWFQNRRAKWKRKQQKMKGNQQHKTSEINDDVEDQDDDSPSEELHCQSRSESPESPPFKANIKLPFSRSQTELPLPPTIESNQRLSRSTSPHTDSTRVASTPLLPNVIQESINQISMCNQFLVMQNQRSLGSQSSGTPLQSTAPSGLSCLTDNTKNISSTNHPVNGWPLINASSRSSPNILTPLPLSPLQLPLTTSSTQEKLPNNNTSSHLPSLLSLGDISRIDLLKRRDSITQQLPLAEKLDIGLNLPPLPRLSARSDESDSFQLPPIRLAFGPLQQSV